MKALLIKDWKLLKKQKAFVFMIIFMGICLSAFNIMNSTFILCYMTFISHIFVLSSISYDEYDGGYQYLFTLPITRKDYVKEKYCFGSLVTIVSFIVAMMIVLCFDIVDGLLFINFDLICSWIIVLMFAFICMCFFMPIQFHFGKNKGNLAMVCVVGVVFFFSIFYVNYGEYFALLQNMINQMGLLGIAGLICIMMVMFFRWSYYKSLKIMRRKE